MTAIYKRELRSYFNGVMGYIFIAFILAAFGIYTTYICFANRLAEFQYVPYMIKFVFLIAVPILSMRVLSEERKQKTDQLLFSNAIDVSKIVLGKYLAMLTVIAIPIAFVCIYPAFLSAYGPVPLATSYGTLLAFFLMGAALLAIGMFASSLTDSQIVAAAVCFGIILVAYLSNQITSVVSSTAVASYIGFTVIVVLIALITRYMTKSWYAAGIAAVILEAVLTALMLFAPTVLNGALANFLGCIALFDKMDTFKDGVFDINVIVYYISVAALFTFFSMQAVEKRRWS